MGNVDKTAFVHSSANVSARAQIKGTSRIGANVIIGAGVLVQDSVIDGSVSINGGLTIAYSTIEASAGAFISTIEGQGLISTCYSLSGRFSIRKSVEITHSRHYLSLGVIGSEHRFVTLYRTEGGGHRVIAGCWNGGNGGTLDELEERVAVAYGGFVLGSDYQRHEAEYLAFIALARLRIEEWAQEAAEAK